MSKIQKEVNVLLNQIKAGNSTKMEELHKLTYNHLFLLVFLSLRNVEDCRDVLAETYYRAFYYIQTFNDTLDGYNWLCRIAQNAVINFKKESGRYVLCEDIFEDADYSDELDRMLLKITIGQYLKPLSVSDRALIFYRFFLNLSYGEIAARTNSAKSSVHKRINSLVKKISENFKK